MDQHLAENEGSEGVNGHDCGMMIPTTIRSPSTEQIPGLPFVDKKLEEKRKKARAAQQKHREKNRKEKDTLIQKAALTEKLEDENLSLLNENATLRAQEVNNMETIERLKTELKQSCEECAFWKNQANYDHPIDPMDNYDEDTLFSPSMPDSLLKHFRDEPSHPSSVEEQNDEDSSLDNFPYLSETNINFVLSAKEHGIF